MEYMSDVSFNVMMDSKKSVVKYLASQFIEFGKERKAHKMNKLCIIKKRIKTHWNGVTTPHDNAVQLQRCWIKIQPDADRNGSANWYLLS